MSVISVEKISSQQSSGPSPHDRTYTSTYQIITDQTDDGPVRLYIETQVAGALHLPQVGEFYVWGNESDDIAYMVREPTFNLVEIEKTRRKWHATVVHTTASTGSGGTRARDNSNRYSNPLLEPWSVKLNGDEWTEEASVDVVTGELLGNSAGQPWTGRQAEIYRSRSGWDLSKNRINLDQNLIDYTRGRVNSSAVVIKGRTYTPRTLLLRTVEADEMFHAMVGFYYRFSFKLDTKAETFDIQAADVGTVVKLRFADTYGNEFTDILDGVTQRAIDPPGVPLDGSGQRLAKGEPLVTIRQQKYPLADLNVWQFPA